MPKSPVRRYSEYREKEQPGEEAGPGFLDTEENQFREKARQPRQLAARGEAQQKLVNVHSPKLKKAAGRVQRLLLSCQPYWL